MKRSALVITLFLALVASACGFGAGTAYFNVTQAAVPGSTATVYFDVQDGESTTDIAPRLQAQGLIRNATVFTYYAKYLHKIELKKGTFILSPSYTMDKLLNTLASATPIPQVCVTIPPGLRVLEYPGAVTPKKKGCTEYADDDPQKPAPLPRFHDLPRFNAQDFIDIATSGKYKDGTNVSDSYWFVPKDLHKDAKFALEGYLYPDTYSFNKTADAKEVINTMLDEFGTILCPGPEDNPGAYFDDAKSCQAHMAKVGGDNSTDTILTVAKAKFFTDDPVEAIYKALTLASLVVKESGVRDDHADRGQIADILYRRYLVAQGKLKQPPGENASNFKCLGVDPTAWYAYFSDNAPTDGNYWRIVDSPSKTDPDNPYNTYTHCTDLPPGPIAAPGATAGDPTNNIASVPFLYAATDPKLGAITPDFFYIHDGCLHRRLHVAVTYGQQLANQAKYIDKCPDGD
jgi:UPF0755 protein